MGSRNLARCSLWRTDIGGIEKTGKRPLESQVSPERVELGLLLFLFYVAISKHVPSDTSDPEKP